jgi:hypothetical protein
MACTLKPETVFRRQYTSFVSSTRFPYNCATAFILVPLYQVSLCPPPATLTHTFCSTATAQNLGAGPGTWAVAVAEADAGAVVSSRTAAHELADQLAQDWDPAPLAQAWLAQRRSAALTQADDTLCAAAVGWGGGPHNR